MTQTNLASHSKALYARLPRVESKHCFFRVFLSGYGKTTSVAAGKKVRGTQGSLKKWCESLNECEKSVKKAKYVAAKLLKPRS